MIGLAASTLAVVVVALLLLRQSVSPMLPAHVTCASFRSQAAAQAYYRAAPVTGAHLDRDHDGIACEANRVPRDFEPVHQG